METYQYNNGGGMGVESRGKEAEVVVNNRATVRCSELVLRVLGLALTLVAAIVLGVDKQTEVVPVSLVPTLPPLNVPVTAKWHYMSAFVYFVVANAIACAYAALSVVLIIATGGGRQSRGRSGLMIFVLDLIMVALLFSGNGAAGAVGLVGYEGNSHVRWNKVCNVFGKFCHQVAAAIVVSLLGSAAFLLLVVLAARNLHKNHN